MSKRFFSLIELMVVLTIIGIASSVVGIKISKSIKEYGYQRAIGHLSERLKIAKKLSLVNQCDVYLVLVQEKNGISSEIGYYGGSGESGKKVDRCVFPSVRFNFHSENKGTIEDSLVLVFTSTGDCLPRGVLCLYSIDGSKKKDIDFKELFVRGSN